MFNVVLMGVVRSSWFVGRGSWFVARSYTALAILGGYRRCRSAMFFLRDLRPHLCSLGVVA